jgi:hypothetical protein
MEHAKRLQEEVEKTLASLEGIERAEPKVFFYTRLRAKLDSKQTVSRSLGWMQRPAYALLALALMLGLNLLTLSLLSGSRRQGFNQQEFAETYGLNTDSALSIK